MQTAVLAVPRAIQRPSARCVPSAASPSLASPLHTFCALSSKRHFRLSWRLPFHPNLAAASFPQRLDDGSQRPLRAVHRDRHEEEEAAAQGNARKERVFPMSKLIEAGLIAPGERCLFFNYRLRAARIKPAVAVPRPLR